MIAFILSLILDDPAPGKSQGIRSGSVFADSPREIPSTSLRAGSSLRLKNGSAQDDADCLLRSEQLTRLTTKDTKEIPTEG